MSSEGPLWPGILDWMYTQRITPQYFREKDIHESEVQIRRVMDVVGEDRETAEDTLNYMAEVGLLERTRVSSDGRAVYTLSEKGFEVAHDRNLAREQARREERQDRRQHSVNTAIAVLTLGLILIGAVDTSVRAGVGSGFSEGLLLTLSSFSWLAAVGMFLIVWRAGLISDYD